MSPMFTRTLQFVFAATLFSFCTLSAQVTKTFSMIKPTAVQENHVGGIIDKLEQAGLKIKGLRMTRLSQEQAKAFYKEHDGKPFFATLVEKMTAGPVVVMVVEGDDAVASLRKVIGATNPEKADTGTIRKLYGKNVTENAIHGSDSNESAAREIAFFFTTDQTF